MLRGGKCIASTESPPVRPPREASFPLHKAAASRTQSKALEHYGLADSFKRSGNSGPCPLHNGQNRTQFRVSLEKNCWNCFVTCKGGGTILDFVARKEGCSLREAALIQKAVTPDERIVVMFDEDDAGRDGREKAVARLS